MGLDRGIRLQSGFAVPVPICPGRQTVVPPLVSRTSGLDPIGDELRIAGVPRLPKSPFELNVVFFFEPLRLGLVRTCRGTSKLPCTRTHCEHPSERPGDTTRRFLGVADAIQTGTLLSSPALLPTFS